MVKKFIKFCVISCTILVLIGIAGGLVTGLYYYYRLTRDLPRIARISDYRPEAISSMYAEDGKLMGELYGDERRYPVAFDEIPDIVKSAFLAAEDANFYKHPGIDFVSILRAMWVNFRHKKTRQGASTITQQVVKSLLLTREKTYERKAKEAILSYRLEQALSKDDILSIYLNEIYLGSTAYGVKAAVQILFHKELSEVTIAEAAYLAGLPQKPSYLSDPRNRKEAFGRQRYVLGQMLKVGVITSEEHEEALEQEVVIHRPSRRKIFHAPYYYSYVQKLLESKFGKKMHTPGGYKIYTTADLAADRMARVALRRGLREVDKRRGWRGPLAKVEAGEVADLLDSQAVVEDGGIKTAQIYRALVTKIVGQGAEVRVGDFEGRVNFKKSKWARKLLDETDRSQTVNLARHIKPGHIIEVSLAEDKKKKGEPKPKQLESEVLEFVVDQTPNLEASFVAANALTGAVKVIIGGYEYERSEFNRATQGLRQPGSAFKPIIYLSALERLKFTPATIVPDSPVSMMGGDGKLWTPQNYDHKFLGPITLRTALQRSRNVVSVYLLTQLGVEAAIETAKRLGISTKIPPEMSISLGTAEVKLIELVRAYGAFATGGWLADRLVITKIEDRDGKVIYEQRPKQKLVIQEEEAFIMANMMKGVVERGTAQRVKKLGRPVAGKTGTTNEQMDAWFMGYTPEWVAGAWVGFDVKKTIGRFETGGKAAAPIFLYFMEEFLKDDLALDFDIPNGVIPVAIHPATGRLADDDDPYAFTEYFKSGTEPRYTASDIAVPRDYLSNEEF